MIRKFVAIRPSKAMRVTIVARTFVLLTLGLCSTSVRAESGLIFDVAENVSPEDLQTVKAGIDVARAYLEEFLEGYNPGSASSWRKS